MRRPIRANVPRGAVWIIEATAQVVGMTPAQLVGRSRSAAEVQARVLAAHVMRAHGYSQTQTGAALGGRDHTTILHALSKPVSSQDIDRIERLLAGETVDDLPLVEVARQTMPKREMPAPLPRRPSVEVVEIPMGLARARDLRRRGATLRSLAILCGVTPEQLGRVL